MDVVISPHLGPDDVLRAWTDLGNRVVLPPPEFHPEVVSISVDLVDAGDDPVQDRAFLGDVPRRGHKYSNQSHGFSQGSPLYPLHGSSGPARVDSNRFTGRSASCDLS